MRRGATAALLLVLGLLAGCAGKQVDTLPDMVWPEPPDPPRIEYLDRITGSRWIQRRKGNFAFREKIGANLRTIDLGKPFDVTTADDGRIFISDSAKLGILWLDPVRNRFGTWGDEGQFTVGKALGLAWDEEADELYVVDSAATAVRVFDTKGQHLRKIGGPEYFSRMAGVAVDPERDRVYVSDTKGHKIEVFTRAGEHLLTIGERGTELGQLNFPTFLAVGPAGRLHVGDFGNFRIQRFAPDGSVVDSHGKPGVQMGTFHRLKGLDVDGAGRIWAVDASTGWVQIFDEQFQLLLIFSGFGSNPGFLNLPAGIDVTADGTIYAVSQIGRTIEVFRLLSEEESQARAIDASEPSAPGGPPDAEPAPDRSELGAVESRLKPDEFSTDHPSRSPVRQTDAARSNDSSLPYHGEQEK
jgi:sugar lactone lactonase YvrE